MVVGGGIQINVTAIRQCTEVPPNVNSGGAFLNDTTTLCAELPRLELQIFAIFFFSNAFHFILKRFRIPTLVSQILVRAILLDWPLVHQAGLGMQANYSRIMFTIDSKQILGTVSGLGYILFGFMIGVKMDFTLIRKTGRMPAFCGILSVMIPMVVGTATMMNIIRYGKLGILDTISLFRVLTVQSMTPFIVVFILSDLKLTNSELGRLGLSSATASDIMSLFLSLTGFFEGLAQRNRRETFLTKVSMFISFLISLKLVVKPAMLWVIKHTPKGRPVKKAYIDIIIICALGSGILFNFIGINTLLGAVFFGLAVPPGPPIASALVERLECVVSGVLVPLFMAMCAMRTDLREVNFDDDLMKSTAIVVMVVIFAKFTACLIPQLYYNMPKQEAFALAFIMSSKGIIELGAYTYLAEAGIMTEGMFAFLVVMILLSAAITTIFVNWLYDPSRKYAGYQKRNIMDSKDLRILTCIYSPGNLTSIIKFLEALCPTTGNPVSVSVLHLIKISGRNSPLFISHQMQAETGCHQSVSENVIRSFNHFRRNHLIRGSINIFTSISRPEFMHEDICTLALNELSCFIVIPFHRKRLIDGSTVSEDNTLRTLNRCVLDRAPCSVGILIDHGNQPHSISRGASTEQSLLVALIFIGGSDDREALMLAKQMCRQRNISLTVIRLVVSIDEGVMDWETVLVSEVLKEIKHDSVKRQQLKYIEEVAIDGLETSKKIIAMLNTYDLFIVGRRKDKETPQTAGLGEWNEYPELGHVGNLLASMDTTETYSVLVVQQQIR